MMSQMNQSELLIVANYLLSVRYQVYVYIPNAYMHAPPSEYPDISADILESLHLDEAVANNIIESYSVVYEGLCISDILVVLAEEYRSNPMIDSIYKLFP